MNPFGTTARAIELEGDHILITKREMPASVSLADVREPSTIRKGGLGTTLSLQASGHGNVILRGAGHADARALADSVKAAWVSFNTAAFEREAHRFDRLHAAVPGLARPNRYPAACSLALVLQDSRSLDGSLLSKLKAEAIGGGDFPSASSKPKSFSAIEDNRLSGSASTKSALGNQCVMSNGKP